MQTHRSEPRACPHCRAPLDSHSEIARGAKPKPGDLSICLYCAAMLQFGPSLELTVLSKDEHDRLPPEAQQDLANALKLVRASGPS